MDQIFHAKALFLLAPLIDIQIKVCGYLPTGNVPIVTIDPDVVFFTTIFEILKTETVMSKRGCMCTECENYISMETNHIIRSRIASHGFSPHPCFASTSTLCTCCDCSHIMWARAIVPSIKVLINIDQVNSMAIILNDMLYFF
jgi:hypothetical protein